MPAPHVSTCVLRNPTCGQFAVAEYSVRFREGVDGNARTSLLPHTTAGDAGVAVKRRARSPSLLDSAPADRRRRPYTPGINDL